jgi:N-acetylmuramoyl-L-alanine amidase
MNASILVTKAATHADVGEIYSLGAVAPKNDESYKGPWDCAEFVSWVVYQSIGRLYGCNDNSGNPATVDAWTGFWHRDADDLNLSIDVEEALRTPGAILLRGPRNKKIGHIVISDGQGGTIEAHSTNSGVIRASAMNRRWDCGVKLPELEYATSGTITYAAPSSTIYRFTNPLMQGERVKQIQQKLTDKGFNTNGVDGLFGINTANAVTLFQGANGLVADGEVGPRTLALLGI